ncbi:Predicted transcriptional regulator [Mycoplasmopsis meleagridis]|nr:Predicted transcriptional regulator [Mycoplasmopsis meleagridis]
MENHGTERSTMKLSYKQVMEVINKGLTKTKICEMSGISSSSMTKLTKCDNVTTDVLIKICKVLDCDISDIA